MTYKEVREKFAFLIGRVIVYRLGGEFYGEYTVSSFDSGYEDNEECEEVGLCDGAGNCLFDISISDLEEFLRRGVYSYSTSGGSFEEWTLRPEGYDYKDQFTSLVGYDLVYRVGGFFGDKVTYEGEPKTITSVSFMEDDDGVLKKVYLYGEDGILLRIPREDFGVFLNKREFFNVDEDYRPCVWTLVEPSV